MGEEEEWGCGRVGKGRWEEEGERNRETGGLTLR